jgi:NTP pyrophosphatase (non-canonical NTP hydrolase)
VEHIKTIAEFIVDDVAEQAFREGLKARPSCDDLRIEQIATHYGFTSQADMLTEECAEYMVALNKLRRGKTEAYDNIKEEVADVLIVARQLRYLLGYEDIDRIINEKLDRQIRRIADENAD